MPLIEEVDSGVDDIMSGSTSRESSPSRQKKEKEPPLNNKACIMGDEDDEIDETFAERLWGLTEMFPDSVRNLTSSVAHGSVAGLKSLYSFSRTAFWIFFSSSAILIAPVVLEVERMHIDEATKQQQRQILLGPSAVAVGSGTHNLGMPMPPQR